MNSKDRYTFPNVNEADSEGVVAVGGPFVPERILEAYRQGIFPWSGDPVRWYSPDPRGVFLDVKLPRKLAKMARRGVFSVTYDQAFEAVIRGCATAHADEGIWITESFVQSYTELFREGHAHSVEVWQEDKLVGGLYGVQVGGLFAGESMFHLASNASKIAFAALIKQLILAGAVLLDCQMVTPFTESLGAVWIRRRDYLLLLERALKIKTKGEGKPWPAQGFSS